MNGNALGAGEGLSARSRAGGGLVVIPVVLAVLAGLVLLALAGIEVGAGDVQPPATGKLPSSLALTDIPSSYLALYRAAASRYGLDWTILAGIGRIECDHGRDPDPSCKNEGATNEAGAGGPMQFLASTWQEYGVDGDEDGRKDRWDPADAIYGAASYLRAMGAPAHYDRAIFAYNHDYSYVRSVESWARRYAAEGTTQQTPMPLASSSLDAMQALTTTEIRLIAGTQAMLDPDDGHLALIPSDVPLVVAAMLVAGNELQSLPYGPAGHPNPLGASEEDCSSTVNYVLYRAGIRPLSEIVHENPLAQDYVHWGDSGPGRWVTIYATTVPTDHVFITVAGLRLDTSHDGTDLGPNRDQDGPRWRIFPGIPTWAHWSVRHPAGL